MTSPSNNPSNNPSNDSTVPPVPKTLRTNNLNTNSPRVNQEYEYTSDITVKYIRHMGNDQAIAEAATVLEAEAYLEYRRLNPKNTTGGLLNYLIEHRHGTPFEHTGLTTLVHGPILMWREWHRHRIGFSYNEESGRYKTLKPVFYIPPRHRPMIKVEDWRAGKPKFLTLDQYFADTKAADKFYEEMIIDMKEGYSEEYPRYMRQLERKLDPGLARDNMPVGLYSSCYVTCNTRSMMAFLSLRTFEADALKVSYPLYEIEVAARQLEAIFQHYWPLTHQAFIKHKRLGP